MYNGFDFTRSARNGRGSKWVCAKKNITKCKARLRINIDKTLTVLTLTKQL